ncbi:protein shisa-9 isoform X1 [Anomalospiza imberbis]|uniref:protein shisa-9 isoform X1 n=1 Tax=Anomalospiza imberbis TaxID=187417 RepID=UPI00358ED01D
MRGRRASQTGWKGGRERGGEREGERKGEVAGPSAGLSGGTGGRAAPSLARSFPRPPQRTGWALPAGTALARPPRRISLPRRLDAAAGPSSLPRPALAARPRAGLGGRRGCLRELCERPRRAPRGSGSSWRSAASSSSSGGGSSIAEPGLGGRMEGFIRLLFGYLVADLLTLVCRAQEKAGQQLGSFVVLSGGNHSSLGEQIDPSEPPPTPDFCRGYFDVMGQWDPPFNCSSGEFIFCCGTCGFRFCCKFKKTRLDQSTCTNYETPLWMNTGKPPSRIDDPLHDPTRDKTNLIVYIICGVVAVMVLVGIFTKLGLEKAHRPQREHMSRALADVMRPQGPCTTDHMERDLNIVVHVQHYENMETRPPPNNLHPPQMNNVMPTSPLLPQMAHQHSYPSLGQITNPYEQQPPGKELNKYASLKAVADKVNDDFYTKRRHLAELAAKGSLPLHPVRLDEERAYTIDSGLTRQNGKSRMGKIHTHPLGYNSHYKTWDPNDPSLRRQAFTNKGKHGMGDPTLSDPLTTRSQHYLGPQPYFITNSKTEVTV